MSTYTEHLAKNVTKATLALERAKARLAAAEAERDPAEAQHLADGDGFVAEYLLRLRHAVDVAYRSVERAEASLAEAKARTTAPTLPGME